MGVISVGRIFVVESVSEGEAGRRSLEQLRTSIRMSGGCEIDSCRCSQPAGLLILARDCMASVYIKEVFIISTPGNQQHNVFVLLQQRWH